MAIHKPLPESIPCPRCGKDAFHVYLTAPGVMTANCTNKTIDVAIGKDAESRWNRIMERTEKRNKIRKESGKSGITAVGKDEFVSNDKVLKAIKTPEPTND